MSFSQEYTDDKDVEVKEPEQKEVEVKEEVESQEDFQEPEYTDAQIKAMEKGWNPDGVEGKPFISAEEFLRNESFFDRIHKLERQNKTLQSDMEYMAGQHKKIAELERQKVLDELKAKKKVALAEEDYDAVIDIDERIAEAREETVPDTPSSKEVAPDTVYNEWAARNTWYDESANPDLYEEATTLGYGYQARTGASTPEVLDYVERTMKRLHPEKFNSTPSRRPNSVEGAGTKSPRKKAGPKTYTERDLNDVQRRVMDRYVKTGVMSKEEYIEELVKIGELG